MFTRGASGPPLFLDWTTLCFRGTGYDGHCILNSGNTALPPPGEEGSTTVTFTTTMPASASSAGKALTSYVTMVTMNANQNTIKSADLTTYSSVHPTAVTSVNNPVVDNSAVVAIVPSAPVPPPSASTSDGVFIGVLVAVLLVPFLVSPGPNEERTKTTQRVLWRNTPATKAVEHRPKNPPLQ
jgi:hypothetical protein